jgi:hypothetical protein
MLFFDGLLDILPNSGKLAISQQSVNGMTLRKASLRHAIGFLRFSFGRESASRICGG